MTDSFFSQNYRALPEISRAVRNGFARADLDKMASVDGVTDVLWGMKKYVTLTITSFAVGASEGPSNFNNSQVLAEHVKPHVSQLVRSVHYGDCALVLGLVKEGSLDDLARRTSAFYGDAAEILAALGQNGRVFWYMASKSVPLIESMGIIGEELDLV